MTGQERQDEQDEQDEQLPVPISIIQTCLLLVIALGVLMVAWLIAVQNNLLVHSGAGAGQAPSTVFQFSAPEPPRPDHTPHV